MINPDIFMTKAVTSKRRIFNNSLRLLSVAMRRARSHAKDYVTSLNDQNEQIFEHIQNAQVIIEPLLTWKKIRDSIFDPRSGDCFVHCA